MMETARRKLARLFTFIWLACHYSIRECEKSPLHGPLSPAKGISATHAMNLMLNHLQ
jgi:hypothetical protein